MTNSSMNDWSITPNLNADIAGTSIAVNCAPQNIGVFARTVLSQVAYAVQGTPGLYPTTWRVGTLNADVSNVTTANVTGTLTAGTFAAGALAPTSLAVTNNATIGGTLAVTGAVTLSSTLGVSGTANISGAVTTGSTVSVGTNLTVNGTTALLGNVSTTGTLSTSSTVNVGTNLQVSGNAAVANVMSISGSGASALFLPNGGINVAGQSSSGAVSGWWLNSSGAGPAPLPNLAVGIQATYNMLAAGFYAQSDARLKDDVATISPSDGEEAVRLWRPVTYLKQGRHEAGFIAQEMALAGYDQYVGLTPNDAIEEYVDARGNVFPAGFELNLNYNNCIAYHNACLQSLMNKNETLTTALQSALARIEVLEGKLA